MRVMIAPLPTIQCNLDGERFETGKPFYEMLGHRRRLLNRLGLPNCYLGKEQWSNGDAKKYGHS